MHSLCLWRSESGIATHHVTNQTSLFPFNCCLATALECKLTRSLITRLCLGIGQLSFDYRDTHEMHTLGFFVHSGSYHTPHSIQLLTVTRRQ